MNRSDQIDAFVERNRRMLGCDNAKPRDVQSLQNWVHGNACLNWEETKYLDHEEDLFAISSIGDNATRKLEAWVEDSLARWFRKSGKVRTMRRIRILALS